MNAKLILMVLVIAGLSSCSRAYKIAQTPDDVYYSPAPPQEVYVQVKNDDDKNVYSNSTPEDREILRHINNRRWRRLHGYDDNYGYGYYPYGNNYPVYIDPKTGSSPSTNTGPRKYNLGTATTPPATSTTSNGNPVRTFTKPAGTAVGNFIRRVFRSSNEDSYTNSSDNTTQSRTYQPAKNNSSTSNSSSSGSSRSSSSSGNAPVRSFHK